MHIKRSATALILGLGLILALLGPLTGGPTLVRPAYADSFEVTSTASSGPNTLHQAILDANDHPGHDTIDFSSQARGTIELNAPLPTIVDDVTINGPGAGLLAVSGDNAHQVFVIDGANVTISDLTVRDGSAANGGAFYVAAGTATLNQAKVLNSSATARGGGIYITLGTMILNGTQVVNNSASNGGGVYVHYPGAALDVTESLISFNSAQEHGGGIYVGEGSVSLENTQVVDNSAYHGSGIYVGLSDATLDASGGEIHGNSSDDPNGSGGGIYVLQGSATLTGTRVSGNSANATGGGVHVDETGSATLIGTPLLHNVASNGGALSLYSDHGAITANDGCIVGNSDSAVYNIGSPTLDATDIWWGDADGPTGGGGSGDSISGNVSFSPIKTSPPPGCPGHTGVDLAIAKSVTPTIVIPGAPLTYTLTFSNAGSGTATGITVTDHIPASVIDTSVSASGDPFIMRRDGTRYLWDISDLDQGQGGTIVVSGVVSELLTMGAFTNTATIAAAEADTAAEDNADDAPVRVTCREDVDSNCEVTVEDLTLVSDHWRCTKSEDDCYDPLYDLDGDDKITVIDMMQVTGQWGVSCP